MNETQRFMNNALKPFPQICPEKREKIFRYLSLVLETNRTTNLTAITNWEEAVIKHIYDSLMVTRLLTWANWSKVLDLGSGAGFPGVPLAIAFPQQAYYLLEANKKKADFLRLVKERFQLENLFILNERAEIIAHQEKHRSQYQTVTARAVAETAVLLELAVPFCQTGGLFVAYKGKNYQEEIAKANQAQETLGAVLKGKYQYELPFAMGDRTILIFQKKRPTPEKYPRRPGIPAKRPL